MQAACKWAQAIALDCVQVVKQLGPDVSADELAQVLAVAIDPHLHPEDVLTV